MTSINAQREYDERCQLAATSQGLDGIADELWRVGIPYEVSNLGGYCMGIVCRRGDMVAVVTTWDAPAVVGLYEYDEWIDGGGPLQHRENVPLVDVVEVVAEFLGGVK